MPTPALPIEDQVLDRIVTVLEAIVAGSTYWSTPKVKKRFVHWAEYSGSFPVYMVSLGSGGERTLHSHHRIDETFYLSIKGYVQDNKDTAEQILKCWQDIRVALTAEMENGAAGSLPSLGVIQLRFREFPETDDGYLAVDQGKGFFDARCEIQFSDTLGYL
jgi:hypothetical protein